MSFYPLSIEAARLAIEQRFPGAAPDKSQGPQKGEIAKPGHLLWMLAEIESWDDTDSVKKAVKAGRWLAWVFRDLEIQGLIDNKETKAAFKLDTIFNYDLPAIFREKA